MYKHSACIITTVRKVKDFYRKKAFCVFMYCMDDSLVNLRSIFKAENILTSHFVRKLYLVISTS